MNAVGEVSARSAKPANKLRLTSAQMARMSRLLDAALALDTDSQRTWLAELGPEDQDIVPALAEALSIGDAGQEAGFATLPKVGSEEAGAPASGLEPGTHVGPYELIRPLGAGGMAEVWLASRADGAFKREVALKLPMLTRLRKDVEARFARERDILAGLEHPNIARLYDAGTDEDGLPYLAMEYVAGEPITSWCDAHKLAIPHRLQLMLQVLDGVQYAHARQVIHRDLKPSNILVTESGQVRLLDFGIAKLLQTEEADRTQLTSVYGRALTPDYASPELICGKEADARSDVYSLGILLYELLTGNRPYRLQTGATAGTLEQAISTATVSKPSTQVGEELAKALEITRERLSRLLRGDLDVIVLKALAKEPAERYPTATAMAEDLSRHLSGEAIAAQPPRLTYRAGKFLRRRHTLVTVAILIATIVAGVGYEIQRTLRVPSPALPAVAPPAHSIAVLPFVDMSEKKDQEYLADGLAEELINKLVQVSELHVPARTSSFYFKGRNATIREIGAALGVANVLEGSVRKSGSVIRINAKLIRVDSGNHVWSKTYDRKLDDVFRIQDEISAEIFGALNVTLTHDVAPMSLGTSNLEANDLYMRARALNNLMTQESVEQQITLLKQAVNLDPAFARAWASLSRAEQAFDFFNNSPAKLKAAQHEGRSAAERAVALAPLVADGHLALGRTFMIINRDMAKARSEIEQAVMLEPNNSDAVLQLGIVDRTEGRLDDALPLYLRAHALDPLNANNMVVLGEFYSSIGDGHSAEAIARQLGALHPTNRYWKGDLETALRLQGKDKEAFETAEQYASGEYEHLWNQAMYYPGLGLQAQADAALSRLERADAKHVPPVWVAFVYAHRGNSDRAFEWIQRQYSLDPEVLRLYIDSQPEFVKLSGDKRYQILRGKLGLPELHLPAVRP